MRSLRAMRGISAAVGLLGILALVPAQAQCRRRRPRSRRTGPGPAAAAGPTRWSPAGCAGDRVDDVLDRDRRPDQMHGDATTDHCGHRRGRRAVRASRAHIGGDRVGRGCGDVHGRPRREGCVRADRQEHGRHGHVLERGVGPAGRRLLRSSRSPSPRWRSRRSLPAATPARCRSPAPRDPEHAGRVPVGRERRVPRRDRRECPSLTDLKKIAARANQRLAVRCRLRRPPRPPRRSR